MKNIFFTCPFTEDVKKGLKTLERFEEVIAMFLQVSKGQTQELNQFEFQQGLHGFSSTGPSLRDGIKVKSLAKAVKQGLL